MNGGFRMDRGHLLVEAGAFWTKCRERTDKLLQLRYKCASVKLAALAASDIPQRRGNNTTNNYVFTDILF